MTNNRIDLTQEAARRAFFYAHIDNSRNRAIPSNNTSGVIGVRAAGKSWHAQIGVGGVTKYLGRFKSKDEAVSCRKQAERFYGYHQNHGRA